MPNRIRWLISSFLAVAVYLYNGGGPVQAQSDFPNDYIVFVNGVRTELSDTNDIRDIEKFGFASIRDKLLAEGYRAENMAYFDYDFHSIDGLVRCDTWASNQAFAGRSDVCKIEGAILTNQLTNPEDIFIVPDYTAEDTQAVGHGTWSPLPDGSAWFGTSSLMYQAEGLEWMLAQIIAHHEEENTSHVNANIHIVAYSLGGVIASTWAVNHGVVSSPDDPTKTTTGSHVRNIILIDSPVGGLPLAKTILTGLCDIPGSIYRSDPGFCLGSDFLIPTFLFNENTLTQLQEKQHGGSIIGGLEETSTYFDVTSIVSSVSLMANNQFRTIVHDVIALLNPLEGPTTSVRSGISTQNWQGVYADYYEEKLGREGITLAPTWLPMIQPYYLWALERNHVEAVRSPKTADYTVSSIRRICTAVSAANVNGLCTSPDIELTFGFEEVIPDGSIPEHDVGPKVPADAYNVTYWDGPTPDPGNGVQSCNPNGDYFESPYLFLDWGLNAPHGDCPADHWSAKIWRNMHFEAGEYTFYLFSDEKARVRLEGIPSHNSNGWIVDNWDNTQRIESVTIPSSGSRNIVVEHQETVDRSWLHVWWEGGNYPAKPQEQPDPDQWHHAFWVGTDFQGDAIMQFNDGNALPFNKYWGGGGPGYDFTPKEWSSKVRRDYYFECGTYTFKLGADDLATLKVTDITTGKELVNLATPTNNSFTQSASPVLLPEGRFRVSVEHKEFGGSSQLEIDWEQNSTCIIPVDVNPASSSEGTLLHSFETNFEGLTASDATGNVELSQFWVSHGAQAVRLSTTDYWNQYYINYGTPRDFSEYDGIELHLAHSHPNNGEVILAIYNPTDGWQSSSGKPVPGGGMIVSFDFIADWGTTIDWSQINSLYFIVNGDMDSVVIDNVRLLGGSSSGGSGVTPVPSTNGTLLHGWEGGLEGLVASDPTGVITPTSQWASEGNMAVELDTTTYWNQYQVNYGSPQDFSEYSGIEFHLAHTNAGGADALLAIYNTPNSWQSSSTKSVPAGGAIVTFDFNNDWGTAIDWSQINSLYFIINGDMESVVIDNVRLLGSTTSGGGGVTPVPSSNGTLLHGWEGGLEGLVASDPTGVITPTSQWASEGNMAVELDTTTYWNQYEVNYGSPQDFSEYSGIEFHLAHTNAGGADALLAIYNTPNSWQSSSTKSAPSGGTIVSFDFTADWGATIDWSQINNLYFIVNGDMDSVVIDNVRLLGGTTGSSVTSQIQGGETQDTGTNTQPQIYIPLIE